MNRNNIFTPPSFPDPLADLKKTMWEMAELQKKIVETMKDVVDHQKTQQELLAELVAHLHSQSQ